MNKKRLLSLALAACLPFAATAAPDEFVNKKSEGKAPTASVEKAATEANRAADDAVVAQTLAAALKDLKINTFPGSLLKVDPATFDNELQYTAAEEKTVIYFGDDDPEAVDEAVPDGYYREILGKNDDGRTIAQDFYQNSKTPQTAPFILIEGGERNFSTEYNDGRIIWYSPEGKVTQIGEFEDGSLKNWFSHYEDGKLIAHSRWIGEEETVMQLVVLDENGKVLALMDDGVLTLYYPDGRPMFAENTRRRPRPLFWDEKGNLVELQEIQPQLEERMEYFLKKVQTVIEN